MCKYPKYFGAVDDCSICPFSEDNAKDFNYSFVCTCNPEDYLPCICEELYDCSIKEVVKKVADMEKTRVAFYYNELKEEENRKSRYRNAAKKASETRFENRDINAKISVLRSRIRERKINIRRFSSLIQAANVSSAFYPQMRGNRDNFKENVQIKEWQIENEKDILELNRLIELRDKRNRERRKNNK